MKNVILCSALIVMFFISGCVMRTYTTEIDRVDQEIIGNRGFIMGAPPETSEVGQVNKTRKIYNVEVEVPSIYKVAKDKGKEASGIEDKELYGNRGYIQGSVAPEKEVYVTESGKEEQVPAERLGQGLRLSKMPQIVYSEPLGGSGISSSGAQKEYYVVQKGDTLQKISEKFFGTTQKWKTIYEANKHILKSPDRIRPGQKLLIPKE